MKPDIRITWNDGFAIAYQVVGRGRQDLVYLPGFASNVDLMWDVPSYRLFLERLASFSRLIVLDRRGTGCSDRLPPGSAPTLEEITDDVLAVMEAASSPHATLFAVQEGAFAALLLAASHPYRVERLILFGASPSWVQSDDLPDEWPVTRWESETRAWLRTTSAMDAVGGYIKYGVPSLLGDEAAERAVASLLFNTQGIGAAAEESRMLSGIDLRHILPSIAVPALVLRRAGDKLVAESSSRHLAERIPMAQFQEIQGEDTLPWTADQEPILEAIERFMGVQTARPRSERRLATVLFTDIVNSTARAAALGDRAWRELRERHDRAVRDLLARFQGEEVKAMGDGFLATFDGPARAVHCASAINAAVADLGLNIRAGLHTGEVEPEGHDVTGIAVTIGARVAQAASPSEVLVSQTVKDLTAGSGLIFEDAGEHELKGVPDRWRLYRVAR